LNILFLSYWGFNEGLSRATVHPHLNILADFEQVNTIVYVSIERDEERDFDLSGISGKTKHIPLYSKNIKHHYLNKINDFFSFPRSLESLIEENNIRLIIARGTPAGALIWKIGRNKGIPFVVESFEPHGRYMIDAGVWGQCDIKYTMQKQWEAKQIKHASFLLPVAENYRRKLIESGVDGEKIITVPCNVPLDQFAFSETKRKEIRKRLAIPEDALVGVYVGKFNGMYMGEEAIHLFQRAFDFFKDQFHLLIITPSNDEVNLLLDKHKLPVGRYNVLSSPHNEIPNFLSASDFSFTPFKKFPSAKYLSPIKIGEYWANGLPTILTAGVGDEDAIISDTGLGAIYDPGKNNLDEVFQCIKELLADKHHKEKITALAVKYRNFHSTIEAYVEILSSISEK